MEGLLKEEIFTILKNNLSNIYCQTCKYEDNQSKCDECQRKNMNWRPSDKFLNLITAGIISCFTNDLYRWIDNK